MHQGNPIDRFTCVIDSALRDLIRVRNSSIGRGVFARRRIRRGQIIGEVRGAIVRELSEDDQYYIALGPRVTLDPEPPFRFLNHSCQPNCALRLQMRSHRVPRLFVEALRTIHIGEELRNDYKWPAEGAVRCRCRAPLCRGWIVDRSELHKLAAAARRDGRRPGRKSSSARKRT